MWRRVKQGKADPGLSQQGPIKKAAPESLSPSWLATVPPEQELHRITRCQNKGEVPLCYPYLGFGHPEVSKSWLHSPTPPGQPRGTPFPHLPSSTSLRPCNSCSPWSPSAFVPHPVAPSRDPRPQCKPHTPLPRPSPDLGPGPTRSTWGRLRLALSHLLPPAARPDPHGLRSTSQQHLPSTRFPPRIPSLRKRNEYRPGYHQKAKIEVSPAKTAAMLVRGRLGAFWLTAGQRRMRPWQRRPY